jgi:hypothetical protein
MALRSVSSINHRQIVAAHDLARLLEVTLEMAPCILQVLEWRWQ